MSTIRRKIFGKTVVMDKVEDMGSYYELFFVLDQCKVKVVVEELTQEKYDRMVNYQNDDEVINAIYKKYLELYKMQLGLKDVTVYIYNCTEEWIGTEDFNSTKNELIRVFSRKNANVEVVVLKDYTHMR